MNTKTIENVFLKQRRGFLYNAVNTIALGTEMTIDSSAKGIPVPRHSDFSKTLSIAKLKGRRIFCY